MTQTTIDWLRFRTQAEPRAGLEALRGLFGDLGSSLSLRPLERGMDGFQQACTVGIADMPLGRCDFGGDSQRGWVRWNFPGKGCEWVKDWDALAEVEALPASEIRRVDIALTTWEGEVTHECVVAAHEVGLFGCGGRPPDMQIISSTNPRAGRTCSVGKRDSDKYFRAYEKGFEMASKLSCGGFDVTHLDGKRVEDIYRCEVELKAEARVLPWEIVERRDHYFSGCYPFLAELLPDVGSDILMRRPERAPQTELLAALANCRVQYGATLYTALRAYHGDMGRVWEQVIGQQHNPNLLAAGVLLVDHE